MERMTALITPADTVRNPAARRQSRLFLSLVAALMSVIGPLSLFWMALTPYRMPAFLTGGTVLIGLLAMYLLGRTPKYRLALWITVLSVVLSGFGLWALRVDKPVPLFFIIFGVFLAGLFLSPYVAAGLSVLAVGGLLLTRQETLPLVEQISFLVISSVVSVVLALIREREQWEFERDLIKTIAHERNQLRSSLEEERSKALAAIIQDASHELKTPLAVITTNAYYLKKVLTDPKQQESAAIIARQAEQLKELINDLFVMSRLESASKLSLHRVDILDIIHEVEKKIRPMAAMKGVKMRSELSSNVPLLLLDRNEIDRAFVNIVGNAVRYTPKDGSVILRLYREPHHAVFEVTDTGRGISEKDLPRIFDRFYRGTGQTRTTDAGGSGLGLSITKKIIEAHNGDIKVTSQVGKGTSFKVYLPLLTEE
jgi:signal transduction histidine kinase